MELEREKLINFNRQLRRVYLVAGAQMMVSFIGLCCIICGVDINYAIHAVILSLACFVLVYLQPWKIAMALHFGMTSQEQLKHALEQIEERNKSEKI